MKRIGYTMLALFYACGNQEEILEETSLLPESLSLLEAPLQTSSLQEKTLWATWYYVPTVSHVLGGIPLRNMTGNILGPTLSQKDWCKAAMQGTVRVQKADGSYAVYNYAGKTTSYYVDCSAYYNNPPSGQVKFGISKGLYGQGVDNYLLRPYRSLATDKNFIKPGTVLYIPEAKGQEVILPHGEKWIHDGYFLASDAGGLIKGNHIDVFLGTATKNPFSWVKSKEAETFKAYIVTDAQIISKLQNEARTPQCFQKGEVEDKCLKVNIPENMRVQNSLTFSGLAGFGIEKVKFEVDGWALGTADVLQTEYSLSYKFIGAGERKLTIYGLDATGKVVQTQTSSLVVKPAFEPCLGSPLSEPFCLNLNWDSQKEPQKGVPFAFSGFTGPEVSQVSFYVDGWKLGTVKSENQQFLLNYKFNQAGEKRLLKIEALDEMGNVVSFVEKEITVKDIVEDHSIQKYLKEAYLDIFSNDKNLGYSMTTNGHTRDLYYKNESVFKINGRSSHCVGITFQILLEALNRYVAQTQDTKAWNMPSTAMKWSPFKSCWYVTGGCVGAADAISKYGMGTKIKDFEKLQFGDFVNYDRTNGSGHSVMFLSFIDIDGKEQLSYHTGVKGFRYISSQGSTNGVAHKNAYFSGTCPSQVASKDCDIVKASLVAGRVSEPSSFRAQALLAFVDEQEPVSLPHLARFNDVELE